MSRHRTLRGLVHGLGHSLGMKRLELDEEGVCALSFDERIIVHIAAAEPGGTAMFYAPLGTIPSSRKAELHERMLAANFQVAAHNLTLSLDGGGAPVLLSHTRVEHLSNAEFEQVVTHFVEAAETWLRELEASPAPEAAATEPFRFDSYASMRA